MTSVTKQFKWEEKYSVKVPSLDIQHQRFFEITNDILNVFNNVNQQDKKDQLTLLIVDLGHYALHHLEYEEKCMDKSKCEGREEHTQVHDSYREKIKSYLTEVRKEDIDINSLAKEAAEFSQNWLSEHILSKDKEYIACLISHNIK